MSRIAIKHVKELAEKSNQQMAIVFGFDKDSVSHVATWGKTSDDCNNAADLGNKMKKGLGWPENLCDAQPSRVRKLRKEITAKDAEIERLRNGWMALICAGCGWENCGHSCKNGDYCQATKEIISGEEVPYA